MAQQNEPASEAKTSIDSLLELLNDKGKMDLNSVSISLGVSPSIVEEWAKVLENGKLIMVNYEVGKMYLSPVAEGGTPEKSVTARSGAQRSALQNEMEVEKITLDKYSKNLEDLSTTVVGMESSYREKMPQIQKLFAELDSVSLPMSKKMAELQATEKSAEAYFSQLDAKVNDIYNKINTLSGTNIDRVLKQKEETLRLSLSRADSAKATLLDLEDTKQALYNKVAGDIDSQVKEFKAGLKASISQIYFELRADAAEAVSVDKEIRTEFAETKKIAGQAEQLKKDLEAARVAIVASRNSYKDRYSKVAGEIAATTDAFTKKYEAAQAQVSEFKTLTGQVSKVHDAIENAKVQIAEIQKTIDASKASVDGILNELRALNLNKTMDDAQKTKAAQELSKKSLAAKMKAERINRSIKDTESELKRQVGGEG